MMAQRFLPILIKHSLYCSFDFTLLSLISFVPIQHLSPLTSIKKRVQA